MANTTNSKLSTLITSQVPFFVRNDHEMFVRFMEAYYEYLEQQGKTINQAKNLPEHRDVDSTIDEFSDHFHKNFLALLPKDKIEDQGYILKHIKDFYRSRGTEKSIRFLLRLLYGKEAEFYYPKRDVLRASDGKWFVEKSIKLFDVKINGVANTDPNVYDRFIGRKITGTNSGAFAIVEKLESYYEGGTPVKELKLSGQYKDFTSGEEVTTIYTENGIDYGLSANLYSGVLNDVRLVSGGTNYQVGDVVKIESNTGTGGIIIVSSVSTGNILSIGVIQGGAGFQANNQLLITGATGSGAAGNVFTVQADGTTHPNSYNVNWQTIGLYANVKLNASNYFATSANANVNTTLINALSTFVYSNTGPIVSTWLYSSGTDYTTQPTISVQANSRIRNMGILGRLQINDGGTGYRIGDWIEFINPIGGYGRGANAIVTNVNVQAANSITSLRFISSGNNEVAGGVGYDMSYLPRCNVRSSNVQASGANIAVTAILGYGEQLVPVTSTIGTIQTLSIISRGVGYSSNPTLNLKSIGDGTAIATVSFITGTYTYPGRYINDDGHLSGYNFLEDKEYYQPFSYVIKVQESIETYRKIIKDIVHPAGMKLFGEYSFVAGNSVNGAIQSVIGVTSNSWLLGTYVATGNSIGTTVTITNTGQNTAGMVNVAVEFATGNTIYLANGFYRANIVNTIAFRIYTANTVNSSGNLYFSRA